MPAANNYKAPTGFYQNYTFDKNGQLFADGKELNGIRLDIGGLKIPEQDKPNGFDMLTLNINKQPPKNPFLEGGKIAGLTTDKQGNVYAEVSNPGAPESSNPFLLTPRAATQRIQLSGVQLDPNRFSKSGDGDLGNNQLYLRPDDSGAYFAQINKGNQIAAYAYSAIQQATNPTGGPETPTSNNQRRQGGNAGGGVSPTSSMVSLLGD